MSGWWLDRSVNLVGTVVGALLALVSAWWRRRLQQRRDDGRLLQNLVDGLHRKRAFRQVPVSDDQLVEWDEEDLQRCVDSVLGARRCIEEAAARLSTSTEVRIAMGDMHSACNRWLRRTRRRPGSHVIVLMDLRARLLKLKGEIVDEHRKLTLREPGGGE